ncbi:MAG TPA: ATP-binding protein [Candidatus Acidoferrales bacterium]|nr:ATP-binding protein [Candidatus Acidoferrales bacterium]
MDDGVAELRMTRTAARANVRPMRHALRSFLEALELAPDTVDDVLTAVGEVLANAVEHAYVDGAAGSVEVYAHVKGSSTLEIDVKDSGTYIERSARVGRGFGLRIARAIARSVEIDRSRGTRVHLSFDTDQRRRHIRAVK